MTWVKLDDGFISHPKTFGLSHKAIVLHVAGLCHSAANLLDGIITKDRMPAVLGVARCTRRHLTELVDAGMWVDQGEHYEIHDYLEYQESRATVQKRRTDGAARKRRSRMESQRDDPCDSEGPSQDTRPVPTRSSPSDSVSGSTSIPPSRVDTYMDPVDKPVGEGEETESPVVRDIAHIFTTVTEAAS